MAPQATLRDSCGELNGMRLFGTQANKPERNTYLYRLPIQTSQYVPSVVACYVMRTDAMRPRAKLPMTSS